MNFRYGNCFTFNKRNEGMKPLLVSETGYKSGLHMELNLNIDEYLNTTHTIGAKIIIHEPTENPNPEDDGFIVSPGYEFTVSLKQTVYHRLSSPYKDHCFNYNSQAGNAMRSKNSCIRTCIQRKNFENCGCIDQTLGVMNELKPCDFTDKTDACCLDKVLDNMSRNGPTCSCNLPCRSVYYNEMISKARLRASEFCEMDSEGFPFCFQLRNHLKLNIYYSSLERYVYEQRAKWELTELVSLIGNELELWLGIDKGLHRKLLLQHPPDQQHPTSSSTTNKTTFLQINLRKSKITISAMLEARNSHNPSLFLVQEPYILDGSNRPKILELVAL
ncbi:Degenerin-like protein unc-105 [Araneus ventricosus]|uniref:Degenerin-like protein unc-105 n=1 Tax=Araneus ventricosus TaxID=182803 RepID=A0A4Y2MN02_ARAVE|nr:Degenerin-like protein unc-105 [Araneus ventricosus]